MLIVIIAFSIMCVAIFMVNLYSIDQYSHALTNVQNYESLSSDLSQASMAFNTYIQDNSSDSYNDYLSFLNNSRKDIQTMKSVAKSENIDLYYLLIDVEEIINSYEKQNDEIMGLLPNNSVFQIYPKITYSQTLYEYANIRMSSFLKLQMELLQNKTNEISVSLTSIIMVISVILIVLFVSILFLSLNLSRKITEPIEQLTEYATNISKGNFDVQNNVNNTSSEIETLSNTLDYTKNEIKGMIQELQDKAEIEAKLHEKEIENLMISNDLKNTEIRMLQAQINPHFLFNTLNSIGRMANLNGNKDIETLIYSLSDMLRYNLSAMDTNITLGQEVENLKRYIYIQQIRFKDKLTTEIRIDTQHLNMPMPALILQPLVENSIEHGLKPYDYNGSITVDIYDSDDMVNIAISDTGVGIDDSIIQAIANNTYNKKESKHSGIGLMNVIKRLQTFFNDEKCVVIKTASGEGTTITIKVKPGEYNEI